jgi:hypothetical protein
MERKGIFSWQEEFLSQDRVFIDQITKDITFMEIQHFKEHIRDNQGNQSAQVKYFEQDRLPPPKIIFYARFC